METATLGTTEAVKRTGLTFRQLDYLYRSGIVEPAVAGTGSGSRHRWAVEQLPILRMAATLRAHGAQAETLRRAVIEAEQLGPKAWGARVVITLDGRIVPPLGSGAHGWLLDLSTCADPITETAAPEPYEEMEPVAV